MTQPQVDDGHYDFQAYLEFPRWSSYWHQCREVLDTPAGPVLEIGPGPGVFQAVVRQLGRDILSLDFDKRVRPDVVASATSLPFADNSFAAVCCFQMLEHLPYEQSQRAFTDMCRVAARRVILSLPDARKAVRISTRVPLLGDSTFLIPLSIIPRRRHVFNGEHYWEINKRGWALEKVVADFERAGRVRLLRTYRAPMNHYHRFFVFEKEL
jgi:predicted SAM-dependent methyltransferase